ncbi:AsmA family protein [Aliifodinibius sp. S!AR15-10]|uniref:AsmA family protein n=1 Tax=Aliifodinibius sp. S!AR15-10 TaxID=2950437 RepID=UPI0028652AE9|nr:AsmA-like C-terminal region-containing protein [Aliifodinibius sp. S!AR15-10]MDR8391717.1 AsmA family protein [Aliifodinibius sp. S!AR15-10]
MKTFLKIFSGLLLFIIVVLIGLNLYFTDERLKETIMPYVEEGIGRPVQVDAMSLTFFRTFPRPGFSISGLSVPGDSPADTLLSLDEFVASVELFSLFGNEISIAEIRLLNPRFTYQVYEDSTTNLDFLLAEETDTTEEAGTLQLNIPKFTVSGGDFGYQDATSNTTVHLVDLNADISLRYADLINSTIDIELGGLTAQVDSSRYVNGLPLSLSQSSSIDLKNEIMNLESGTFSIRGLALNLTGSISNWSANTPSIDLKFNSSSDNFGELLRLVPDEYREQVAGLETRGGLSISGSVSGNVGGELLPSFSADISVTDGYLRNPNLPEPIQNIQLTASASNELITMDKFEATAGSNVISASGRLEQPLNEDAPFSLDLNGDVDLATVDQFYPLGDFSIERLGGKLSVNATASGRLNKPEEAQFNADVSLANGLLKYSDVPNPIENISINAKANQDLVTINSFGLNAAQNKLSLKGQVRNPLDEANRTVDLTTDLFFDLASIKNFYPIDEDTLQLRGELTANATLKGNAEEIERAIQSGSVNLQNGYIAYQKIGEPIENITLNSNLQGNRISISNASFRTGKNDLKLSGSVTNYLGENPVLDLRVQGNAQFAEIQNYYDLRPAINELTGTGQLDLSVQGALQEPENMRFNGRAVVNNVNMSGDSLGQPVSNLNGELKLSPKSVDLTGLSFKLGSSDLNLGGSLQNYMEYLELAENRATTPNLTGTFKSSLFNMDELIDWEDTTEASPIPIELPDLTSSVTANIGTLIITGVKMTNLEAQAGTTPTQIKLDRAFIELFEGTATGSFVWNVPQPDRTNLNFKGELDSLNINAFFREFPVMGEKSKFHEHVTGAFSANISYYSELDVYLDPDISTTKMDGTFTMTKSRVKGHPLQNQLATMLKADELRNIALDESETQFSVNNSIMTIKNLGLTSGDIGANMSGTRHLVSNKIDYKLSLFLPGRFRDRIASIISGQAVDALTQDNGTIMLPLRVTGTQDSPTVRPDQDVIKPILKDLIKDKAGDAIRSLFGN